MKLIPKEEMDQILNIRILRLASKLSIIFQRETLRPAGIKAQQWRVLISLAQFGELHLRSIARHSSQDPAHTSRVVKSMLTAGWITSRPDRDDNRRIQFELSPTGEALIEQYWPKAKQFAADLGALFDKDEFEKFKEMLDRANASCEIRLNSNSDKNLID